MTLEQFNNELRSHEFMYNMVCNYKDWSYYHKKELTFWKVMENSEIHKKLYEAWKQYRVYGGLKPDLADFQ